MRRLARGQILQVVATGDQYDTAASATCRVVDASATYDPTTRTAAIFVANRSQTETAQLEVDCRGLPVTPVWSRRTCPARARRRRPPTSPTATATTPIVPRPAPRRRRSTSRCLARRPASPSWTVFELARTEA